MAFVIYIWTAYLAYASSATRFSWPDNSSLTAKQLSASGKIPNPYIWQPNQRNEIVFPHKNPRTPGTRSKPDNPGVSLPNWRHAVQGAQGALWTQQTNAHAGTFDLVPGNRFIYEELIEFPKPGQPPHKSIMFAIEGGADAALEYGRAHVVLLGLLEYTSIWERSGHGAEVYMCEFTYYYRPRSKVYRVAAGRAIIIVVPAAAIVAAS
ncbi:MAG: hypothetical protein L6R40_002906 [Gallowayella cf. fulva]|nr:MAG: hypothetical protein L6R40_002906 [Xanthomendoza cf. fulva]